jgi:DNA-binding response OmpR family regulator
MRVLVVEDESAIAQDIAWIVENEAGYDVAGIAGTVESALAIIAEGQVDGAVLDANLEGQSSETVANELKQKNLPFFILSGYVLNNLLPPALAEAPFLQKPYRESDLVLRLRDLEARPSAAGEAAARES